MEQAQEVQESEIDVYCLDATDFVLNALTHAAFLLRIWNSVGLEKLSEISFLLLMTFIG